MSAARAYNPPLPRGAHRPYGSNVGGIRSTLCNGCRSKKKATENAGKHP